MRPVETLNKAVLHRTGNPKPAEHPNGRRTLRFLVAGGTTTDHHITLSRGVGVDRSDHPILMDDKIPIDNLTSTDGGNGYNLATAFGQLGEAVTLVTPAPPFHAIEKANYERGIDVVALRTKDGDGARRQSYIINILGKRVTLGEEVDRDYTIDFAALHNNPIASERLPEPDVVVLSSVDGESWPTIYREGTDYAKNNGKLLAVLPASKQLKSENVNNPDLHYALENADIIGVNRTELVKLLRAREIQVNNDTPMLDLILLGVSEFGSDKYISVTNDGEPSMLATPDSRVLQLSRYGDGGPTPLGAGDAYAAGLIQAIASGQSAEFAIMQAAINGFKTTHVLDAQSGHQTSEQIEEALAKAPEGFKPIQIFPALPDDDDAQQFATAVV